MAEAKVLPSFHGTRMFNAVLATSHHWSQLEPVANLKETFLWNLLQYSTLINSFASNVDTRFSFPVSATCSAHLIIFNSIALIIL
jgi:hypothetical protein